MCLRQIPSHVVYGRFTWSFGRPSLFVAYDLFEEYSPSDQRSSETVLISAV